MREVVDGYVDAWQRGDVDAVVSMLTEDAAFSMPPMRTWFGGPDGGREEIATFLAEYPLNGRSGAGSRSRSSANGQPALAYYAWDDDAGAYLPFALNVLTLRGERISDVTAFIVRSTEDPDPEVLARMPEQDFERARAGGRLRELRAPGAARLKPVRVGCSGWAYKEWRGAFYPEKLPQRRVARALRDPLRHGRGQQHLLRAAEGRDRRRAGSSRRRAEFRFSVKASRYITHVKRLKSPEKYVERFLARDRAAARGAKRVEAVLWQLPPSFKRDDERLAAALDAIAERAPGRHVVELRHASWFTPDVYSLLNEREVALAIVDDPALPFVERRLTTLVGLRAPAPRQPRLVLEERSSPPGAGGSPPGARGPRRSSTSTTPETSAAENALALRAGLS